MSREDLDNFRALDDSRKTEFLAYVDEFLELDFATFLAWLACDPEQDDLLRIEAIKVIGLYKGNYDGHLIQEKILSLALDQDEDDEIRVYAFNAVSHLEVSKAEIDASAQTVLSDEYVLIKAAAFSLIAQHKHLLVAQAALRAIQGDEEFGKAARRELGTLN